MFWLHPVEGAEQIARYLAGIAGGIPGNVAFLERTVNGQPGLVAQQDGVTATVFSFGIEGDRIRHIWAIRNPDKLRPWTEADARLPDTPPLWPGLAAAGQIHSR